MIVNLLMKVLIYLPIIKFTCQHHVSGCVCHVWHLGILLLIKIISIAKLLIILHFFVLKHEKQTLSYIHTKFEGDLNKFFFFQFILWKHPFFWPNTDNYLGLRGWYPCNYVVWIGLRESCWVWWSVMVKDLTRAESWDSGRCLSYKDGGWHGSICEWMQIVLPLYVSACVSGLPCPKRFKTLQMQHTLLPHHHTLLTCSDVILLM